MGVFAQDRLHFASLYSVHIDEKNKKEQHNH